MDATQRMDFPDDDFTNDEDENKRTQYGILRLSTVGGKTDFDPEIPREFEVFGGETLIGRDPDQCDIVINNKTLSRVHAILDIDDVTSMTIHDNHSLNKTFLNAAQLKPDVHYNIQGGEKITIGEIEMLFEVITPRKKIENSAAGDENGESLSSEIEDANGIPAQVPETTHQAAEALVQANGQASHVNSVPDSPDLIKEEDDAESNKSSVPNHVNETTVNSLNDSSFLAPTQPSPVPVNRVLPTFVEDTKVEDSTSKQGGIFDQETQKLSDIYDMETQALPDQGNGDKDSSEEDLFGAETQAFPDPSSGNDDSYTTIVEENPVKKVEQCSSDKNVSEDGEKDDDEEEDIFFAETQQLENSSEVNNDKDVDLDTSGGSERLLIDVPADNDQVPSPGVHDPPSPPNMTSSPLRDNDSNVDESEAPTQLLDVSSNQDDPDRDPDDDLDDTKIIEHSSSQTSSHSDTVQQSQPEPLNGTSLTTRPMELTVSAATYAKQQMMTEQQQTSSGLTMSQNEQTEAKADNENEVEREEKAKEDDQDEMNDSLPLILPSTQALVDEMRNSKQEMNDSEDEKEVDSQEEVEFEEPDVGRIGASDDSETATNNPTNVAHDVNSESEDDEAKLVIDEECAKQIHEEPLSREQESKSQTGPTSMALPVSTKSFESPADRRRSSRPVKKTSRLLENYDNAPSAQRKVKKQPPSNEPSKQPAPKVEQQPKTPQKQFQPTPKLIDSVVTPSSPVTSQALNLSRSQTEPDSSKLNALAVIALSSKSSPPPPPARPKMEALPTSPAISSASMTYAPPSKPVFGVLPSKLDISAIPLPRNPLPVQEVFPSTSKITISPIPKRVEPASFSSPIRSSPSLPILSSQSPLPSTPSLDVQHILSTLTPVKPVNVLQSPGLATASPKAVKSASPKKSRKNLMKQMAPTSSTPCPPPKPVPRLEAQFKTAPIASTSTSLASIQVSPPKDLIPDIASKDPKNEASIININGPTQESSSSSSLITEIANDTPKKARGSAKKGKKPEAMTSSEQTQESVNASPEKVATPKASRRAAAKVSPKQTPRVRRSTRGATRAEEIEPIPPEIKDSATKIEENPQNKAKRGSRKKVLPQESTGDQPKLQALSPRRVSSARKTRGQKEQVKDEASDETDNTQVEEETPSVSPKTRRKRGAVTPTPVESTTSSESEMQPRAARKRRAAALISSTSNESSSNIPESPKRPRRSAKSKQNVEESPAEVTETRSTRGRKRSVTTVETEEASPVKRRRTEPAKPTRSTRAKAKNEAEESTTTLATGRSRRSNPEKKTQVEVSEEDEELPPPPATAPRRTRRAGKSSDASSSTVPNTRRSSRKVSSTALGTVSSIVQRRDSEISVDSTVSTASSSSSVGRRKSMKPVVMFTRYESPQMKKVVQDLGGVVTENLAECTVLVTEKVCRTAKFLSMVAKGTPIVSPTWIQSSKDIKTFTDPWLHIVNDEESEKKWGFNLRTTLKNSVKSPLLSGYKVFATKSVEPPPNQLKDIVQNAGGQWLRSMPKTSSPKTFVISCPEDKRSLAQAIKANTLICDKELLLTGLLTRELDFKTYQLQL